MDATRKNRQEAEAGAQAATLAMGEYFAELVARRRQEPRADLISAMIQSSLDQDRLSENELIGTCILLLVAGHETSVNLLGTGLLTLHNHPDQMKFLSENPEQVPSAVEEMLRFENPVQRATFRIAVEEFSLNGATIARGQQISAVIGAANRDPEHFDESARFNVQRYPNRHLAFGQGIHFCLGAPLARTEARIAFEYILQRLRGLHLVTDMPAWRHNTFMRGLEKLPLAY
jgi:pimeloyl-[acyl-carrier protein] synthase